MDYSITDDGENRKNGFRISRQSIFGYHGESFMIWSLIKFQQCIFVIKAGGPESKIVKKGSYIVMIHYIIRTVDAIAKICLESIDRIRKPRFQYSTSQ